MLKVDGQPGPKWAEALRWIGGLGMVTIALLRAMVMFTADPYFDVDPVAVPVDFAGLGPAGSLWLDVALLLFASMALFGESLSPRGVKWWMIALALVPVIPVAYHGDASLADLWRGATWASAMIAMVAVAHLGRDHHLRAVVFAACIALAAPLIARGILQVTIEHQELVDGFRRNRLDYFAARGWEPDSNNAKLYERRLMQVEATGWFGLANIYGSVMIPVLIAGVGLTWCAVKRKVSSGWIGVTGLIALIGAAGLVMSGSKGAVGAAVLGLILLIVGTLKPGKWRTIAIIALPVLTILGIVVRGTLLPERFAGDLSLLFRWQYWIGAARIFADSPWLGIGPGSFQAAYALVKPLRNPEEVMSAHSVFIDWLAMLGFLSATWIALIGILLARAGSSVRSMTEGDDAAPLDLPKFAVFAMVGVFVVAGGVAIAMEIDTVDQIGLMARIIGLTAAIIIGGVIAGIAMLQPRAIAWTVLAAVTGLLIHSQMEMTFFQPGSVAWACVLLGVAVSSGVGSGQSVTAKRFGLGFAEVIAFLAIMLGIRHVLPVTRQAMQLSRAASMLHEVGEARLEKQRPAAELRDMEFRARTEAADILESAIDLVPSNQRVRVALLEQLASRASLLTGDARIEAFRTVYRKATAWADSIGTPPIIGLAASLAEELARLDTQPQQWAAAVGWRQRMAELDPFEVESWRALGDAQWREEDRTGAAKSYRRALELDDALDLDPLKKMDADDRAEIEARIRAGSGDSP